MVDRVRALSTWILEEGRCFASVPELLEALSERVRQDLPIDRVWCGTKVLHPQAAAWFWLWTPTDGLITRELSYDRFAQLDSVDSPVQRLRFGAPYIRYIRAVQPEPDLPDIQTLWDQGFHDVYGLSVRFRGAWVGAVTWATRSPEGFDEDDIDLLDGIQPALSAVVEPIAREMVSHTLLRTYLGEDAGDRVAAGQVRRGDGQTIRAAVWFSDVRSFTRLSTELEREALLELLNGVFEEIHGGLKAHGGQILKFIGDGLLGVFPVVGEGAEADAAACRQATAAAAEVQRRLTDLREGRAEAGLVGASVGIGLHFGEVMYGNVGAPVRLDFTVIGEAVNLAARVEGLCGSVGHAVLATEAVSQRSAGWSEVGAFPLKGVDGETVVFTLTEG